MRAWLGFVAAVVLVACKGDEQAKAPPRLDAGAVKKKPVHEVPGDAEGVWRYATVARAREAPPPPFTAPLPASVDQMVRFRRRDPAQPPIEHVKDELCTLDDGMLERLDAALAATPEGERAAVQAGWHELVDLCGSGADVPQFCPRARAMVTGPNRPSREVMLLPYARTCSSAEDAELFARADTPSIAVTTYFWQGGGRNTPPTARLHAAVRERLAAVPTEALLALAATGDDEAIDEAKALCGQAGQPDAFCAELGKRFAVGGRGKPAKGGSNKDAAALADRLRGIGLLGPDPVTLPTNRFRAHTAADVLEAAGRVYSFEAANPTFPNEHVHPARRLAHLCRPALDGAFFAETPPRDWDGEAGSQLHAWVAGEVLTAQTTNSGAWYDVDAVVGLVNEALRTAQSDCRLLRLPGSGQTVVVAGGPAEALLGAQRAGLFDAPAP
jgi:hypothetical protein